MASDDSRSDNPSYNQLFDSNVPEDVQRAIAERMRDAYSGADEDTYGANNPHILGAKRDHYPQERRLHVQTGLWEIGKRFPGTTKAKQYKNRTGTAHFVVLEIGRLIVIEKYVKKPNSKIKAIKYLQSVALEPDLFGTPQSQPLVPCLLVHGRDKKDPVRGKPSFLHIVFPSKVDPCDLSKSLARIDLGQRYNKVLSGESSILEPINYGKLVMPNETFEENDFDFGISLKAMPETGIDYIQPFPNLEEEDEDNFSI